MGNNKSTIVDRELYDKTKYGEPLELNDPRYGNIKLLTKLDNPNEQAAIIQKILNSEEEYELKVRESEFRHSIKHDHLLRLLNFSATKQEEFCSTFFKINQLYEYYTNDLKKDISDRAQNSSFFQESELWYIIQSVLLGLQFLINNKITFGDIRPYMLLITPDGHIKLAENFQYSRPTSAYMQLIMGTDVYKDHPYLPPNLFEALIRKETKPQNVNWNKADIFSLGLTILEAATLKSTADLYNFETGQFKQEILIALIEEVRRAYSSTFTSFLEKMLEFDQDKRAEAEDLIKEIEILVGGDFQQQSVQQQIQNDILQQSPDDHLHNKSPKEVKNALEGDLNNQGTTSANYYSSYVPGQYTNYEFTSYQPITQTYTKTVEVTEKKSELPPVEDKPATNTYSSQYQQSSYQPLSDLDARINAVLAMSRETVQKYGGTSQYYSTTSYTTQTNNQKPVTTTTTTTVEQPLIQTEVKSENQEKKSGFVGDSRQSNLQQNLVQDNKADLVGETRKSNTNPYVPYTGYTNYTSSYVPTYTTSYQPYSANTYTTTTTTYKYVSSSDANGGLQNEGAKDLKGSGLGNQVQAQ